MVNSGVGRLLVEMLGDSGAIAQLGSDTFLGTGEWESAVERVRLVRFGHLSAWAGAEALGAMLGRHFLSSAAGQSLRMQIGLLPLEQALISVVLPLCEDLRPSTQFRHRPKSGGGAFIDVRGAIVVSAATLLDFIGALIEVVPGRHEVRLSGQALHFIGIEVTPIREGKARPQE